MNEKPMRALSESEGKMLREIRGILPNHSPMQIVNAVYISPAQQMINGADRIEYEEELIKRFEKFLVTL